MFNNAGTTDRYYNGTDGIDFDQNLQIKTLDFGTFHLYPRTIYSLIRLILISSLMSCIFSLVERDPRMGY